MANKKEQIVYKSFEQLRSELFPKLVDGEITSQSKQHAEQFGACLADKAINQMLASTSR